MKRESDAVWVAKGCRRIAVMTAISKPMTSVDIFRAAKKISPKIDRRDAARVLGTCAERGIVYAINPNRSQGRIYWLTDRGRALMKNVFHIKVADCPDIDWELYSAIAIGRTRKKVLLKMMDLYELKAGPKIAADIRRGIRDKKAFLAFTVVHRALSELLKMRLVKVGDFTRRRHLRMYEITNKGRKIAAELLR